MYQKYKWNTLIIQAIDWRLHSIQYNTLPATGKRNVARFIYHRLPSGNMMSDNKHRYAFCEMTPDMTIYHDHYLTCTLTTKSKTTRLTSLTLKLDRLNTQPFIRDTILHTIINITTKV